MNAEMEALEVDDVLAKILPPPGYEDCIVVETQGLLIWMTPDQMGPNDTICFYDGDCRKVLKPTDPAARRRFS